MRCKCFMEGIQEISVVVRINEILAIDEAFVSSLQPLP